MKQIHTLNKTGSKSILKVTLATIPAVWIGFIALLAGGCQSESDSPTVVNPPRPNSPNRPKVISEWTPEWNAQKQRAEQWRDQMFQQLVAKLTETTVAQGPVKAIVVCKVDAPAIATQLSRDGVRIGRTSFKLRNPKNTPPDWAADFVSDQVTEPQFVELESQTLGALLPIRLKDTCLMCHGTRDQIPSDVHTAIRANYPQDQAIDFAANDLRGYFWVEVKR